GLYGRYIYEHATKKHYYLKNRQGLYPGYPPADTELLIICESPIDCASLPPLPAKHFGVSCFSAESFPEELLEATAQLPALQEVVFWLDGDAAGRKGTVEHAKKLLAYLQSHPPAFPLDTLKLSAVRMPEGEDLNSLSGKEYAATLFERLAGRVSVEAFAKSPLPAGASEAAPKEAPVSEESSPEGLFLGLDLSALPHLWYQGESVKIRISGGLSKELSKLQGQAHIFSLSDAAALPSRQKIDFYADKSIESAAREAARKLGLQAALIQRDLEQLSILLDAWREGEYRSEASYESNEEKWRKLRHILVDPNQVSEARRFLSDKPRLVWALNRLLGQAGIVGQERQRLLCFCIATTYNQRQTLHGLVRGSSGSGKTHLVKTVLECIPGSRVKPVTRSTSGSFYYFEPYELRGMVLKVEDWEGLDEASRYAIRELQSAGVLYNQTTVKSENGKLETKTWEIYGPVASLICTTEGELVRDNENRTFPLALDESAEQAQQVVAFQNELSARLHDRTKMAQSKAFLSQMSTLLQSYEVYNKYSPRIQLPPKVREPLRLNGMFQSLTDQITLLNQYQRPVHESGCLQTHIDDVEDAIEIMFDSIVWRVDDLNSEQRKFIEALKKYSRKASGLSKNFEHYEFRQIEVRQALAYPSRTLNRYMQELVEMEYLKISHSSAGQLYRITHWQDWEGERSRIKKYLLDQVEAIRREEGLLS
ncbi:MAG: hypothetical protein HC880_15680, partial [Bacteroidia bacterium]|nr:hypothetical protein [Bacteroidia bacterium]